MRPFEILISATLFLYLIGFFFPKRKRPRLMVFLPSLVVVFSVAQLIFEKYRWQMIPLYGLTLLLFLISLNEISKRNTETVRQPASPKRRVCTVILTILGLLFLVIAVALLILFPVVHLPQPTGPYSVGTTYIHFVDENRPEMLTDDPDDHREFTARIWYPAESTAQAQPMPYKENIPPIGVIDSVGPPNFVFDYLDVVRTNSYLDVPISNDQPSYPVIVFSPGFLAHAEDYQLHLEELASHGYIVVGLAHPYESESVVQPDGSIVPFSKEHAANYQQHMEVIIPFWEKFWTTTDENERNEIAKQILANETFMDTVLRVRTTDIQFAIDELEKMNSGEQESSFTGRLDLSDLGIFGHSMGGAVAGQVCLVDERFKAGVNLDGFQWGDVIEGEIQQPFMIMYSEPFAGANDYILERFSDTLYLVTIKGSTHANFGDDPLVMPVTKLIGMAGPISADRMRQITNEYLLSFFDKYLKGEDAPLLAGPPADYPEVEFESRHP